MLALAVLAALLAPWLAPQDPFDPAGFSLMDGFSPPLAEAYSGAVYLLGTDGQGRDMLSAVLYGIGLSLLVGGASVALGAGLGVAIGLAAGSAGPSIDAAAMRLADVFAALPSILVALLAAGIARAISPGLLDGRIAVATVAVSIALSAWVPFARTVRTATRVERTRPYVEAARLTGVGPAAIARRHILPNVLGPVLVLAATGLGIAMITEASLSFLGVGLPPTMPSLGTLIQDGAGYAASGEWWILGFPAIALLALILSVNLLGDRLRRRLDPRGG